MCQDKFGKKSFLIVNMFGHNEIMLGKCVTSEKGILSQTYQHSRLSE